MSATVHDLPRIPDYDVTQLFTVADLKDDQLGWWQESLPESWKAATGKDQILGVVDTGVDHYHATRGDLVDTVIDAVDATGGRTPWDGEQDGHGSHVIGIAAARVKNGPAVGIAPDCKVISAKSLKNGHGQGRWIADGIHACLKGGAHVINISAGSRSRDPHILGATREAVQQGAIVVAAAGNTGQPMDVNSPANLPWVIAISALQEDWTLAPYSSYGPEVAFAAPGSNIVSCWLSGAGPAKYSAASGTSMASPYVAGCLLLLREIHGTLGTPEQAVAMLEAVAVDAGKPGEDPKYGAGIIRVGEQLGDPDSGEAPETITIDGLVINGQPRRFVSVPDGVDESEAAQNPRRLAV